MGSGWSCTTTCQSQQIPCMGRLFLISNLRMDKEAPMHTQTTEEFQHITGENSATLSRNRSDRIRSITYWTFTVLLVFELAAGSVWNLKQIEWVRLQLHHLGYPPYFTYIL